MAELEKAYEPKKYEDDIYRLWEESGFFNPDVCIEKGVCDTDADTYSIVLPPPNVTGTLHMGHAVMLAIEDVMIRYHRMKGDRTLWVPGTDHAAIATQSKVEKILWDEEKKTRHDLGRDEFLKRVEKYAQESHDTIVNQSKKMGASLDWSREAFTLDEKRNVAVRHAFTTMYEDGLIYRGHRIVNWDPKMQCNVSDDEIERIEEKAPFYTFKYGPFEIGTARPETKFGDKYVVMHPDDERYKEYNHGDTFECEWINGTIQATVIKDDYVDPEFGTGVMTITPWHDVNDFYIAERHGLDKEQVIDLDGKLMDIAGEFAGMEIEEARLKIVDKLREKGLLVSVDEQYEHKLATNYRGGGVLEPQIREQWFVDVNKEFAFKGSGIKGIRKGSKVTLKKLMQHVVREGHVEIIPDRFDKTYFHWIDNLKDWCISRQIWYGHQIPAWYKGDEVYVGVQAPSGEGWIQDTDTLDTWFSSGLWTFSTLGWPEKSDDMEYHPTSVLETGYDILFFWVARMILMSTYILGEIPFEKVYLHGLVRDEQGRKMSKTLDNIIDPLDMSIEYGTDATRLSLMIGTAPGNDSKLSEEKIAGYRNFANKLWNISRFILLTIDSPDIDISKPEAKTLADTWVLSRLDQIVGEATQGIEEYRFSQVGESLRDFTWNELADWYLEIAKIEEEKSDILNYVLNTLLKLWHPYMPLVTEAIWTQVYGQERLLMVEKWPTASKKGISSKLLSDFQFMQDIIIALRAIRAEYNIAPAKKIQVVCTSQKTLLQENEEIIKGLARISELVVGEKPVNAATCVVGDCELFVDLEGVVDVQKEQTRIQKELDSLRPYIAGLEKKLGNKKFLDGAPEDVVTQEKDKLSDAQSKLDRLEKQFKTLS